uniref:Uncharacterized protein n=1 Tax=Rhizophora mucronata TaxID=61149 RepID=A0A2P2PW57_RHIMU
MEFLINRFLNFDSAALLTPSFISLP